MVATAVDSPLNGSQSELPAWYIEALKPPKPRPAGILAYIREPEDPRSLEHFVWFCQRLKLDDNAKCVIQEFQRAMFAGYFAGVRETIVVIPKKNAKTSGVALLALHHMIYEVEEPDVIIAASSKEQAARVYNYCEGLILRNERLSQVVKAQGGYRAVFFVDKKHRIGSIRVVPNDPNTVDGVSPTLSLIDEMHRAKSSEVLALLREGCAARDGQLVGISTAGEGEDTMLGQIRAAALKLPIRRYEGRHLVCINEDETFIYHEWAVTDDDDVDDMKVVKLANPLHIHTIDSLRRRRRSPTMALWQWRRFVCGLWGITEGGVLDPIELRRCYGGIGLSPGEPCWVGLDIGWRIDSTAMVPFVYDSAAPHGEQEIVGVPTIIPAPGRGNRSTKPKQIYDALTAIHEVNPIEKVVFDPNAEGNHVASWVRDELDVDVVEHSQDPFPMALSAMALAERIRAQDILLPTEAKGKSAQEQVKLLLKHLTNAGQASIRTGSEKWRFVKQSESMHIDAAIALAIVRRARVEGLGKQKRPPMTLEEIQSLYGVAA